MSQDPRDDDASLGTPERRVIPAPLQYRSPDPMRSRGLTGWIVAVCVLYGMLALPLFAVAILLLRIALDHDLRGPAHSVACFASAALCIGLAILLVRWMIKYIRSVG